MICGTRRHMEQSKGLAGQAKPANLSGSGDWDLLQLPRGARPFV